MIQFPCKCGFRFEVPSDQAGGLVQCPECGLLADVPSMNDVASLHPDGTFAFGSDTHVVDTMTVADRQRIFTNKTLDEYGNEKDLRTSVDDLLLVGETPPPRTAPRYDPETGELIRAIPLKDEIPVPVILLDEPELAPVPVLPLPTLPVPVTPIRVKPAGPVRALTYTASDNTRGATAGSLLVDLFQPANMAVLIFMYFGTLFGRVTLYVISTYCNRFFATIWPFLIVDLPLWWIVSHLGLVVESTGPDAKDELPRPLGNFEIWDDLISPLLRVSLAGVICFLPTFLVVAIAGLSDPAGWTVCGAMFILGCGLFPAVLLTSVAGTTVLNLRPDRVLGVIRESGLPYLVSVGLGFAMVTLGTYYLAGEMLFPQVLDRGHWWIFGSPPAVLAMSGVFVIFLHWFGWHLGTIYRLHHADYPWLAQRHVKRPRPSVQAAK